MRTSCIRWSANQRLVLVRQEQLAFCRDNLCAAALLSYFEYWHSIRMEQSAKSEYENRVAASHNEAGMQNTSLWQFHTADDLMAGILRMYGKSTINEALNLLVELGAIEIGRNPNPRFKFDRTRYFLFHPEVIDEWLEISQSESPEVSNRRDENHRSVPEVSIHVPESEPPSRKSNARTRESGRTITEITTEITSETTPLIDHGAPPGQTGLGKTKAPERTATVQAGQTLNVKPSVASPPISPEVAALAQLLADVGIGVNAFTFEQYKDLADEYGMPAVIAGVHAAANQGKQQSFKYVSACIVNAAKGAGNDNRTAHRANTQTHSAQSPLPGAGRESQKQPARKPYDPRLEAVFNS